MFHIAGCAVASFGCSPPGLDVQALVRAEQANAHPPSVIAARLKQRIDTLPDRGSFGLLVLGNGPERCELWELGSDSIATRHDETGGQLLSRGQPIDLSNLPPPNSLGAATYQMISVFRQAEQQNPFIGRPFDFSMLVWPWPPEAVRRDA
jgi:hypothetical protein